MEFENRVAEYAPKLEALQAELASRGVEFVEVHTVDTSGVVRSKIAPLKLSTSGESINAILYCVTHGDGQPMGDVAFASPSANEENGFPNIKGIIDPATVVRHGWKPKFASAITRSYMLDGAVCPFDPRGVLAEFGQLRVHLISQSSNNLNLTFVVDEDVVDDMLPRLHELLIGAGDLESLQRAALGDEAAAEMGETDPRVVAGNLHPLEHRAVVL